MYATATSKEKTHFSTIKLFFFSCFCNKNEHEKILSYFVSSVFLLISFPLSHICRNGLKGKKEKLVLHVMNGLILITKETEWISEIHILSSVKDERVYFWKWNTFTHTIFVYLLGNIKRRNKKEDENNQ